jgi:hypothetical protein
MKGWVGVGAGVNVGICVGVAGSPPRAGDTSPGAAAGP